VFAFYTVLGEKNVLFFSFFLLLVTICGTATVGTGLWDVFLMNINIDLKLLNHPASRAVGATDGSFFLFQIHTCTRAALLSPRFSLSVLFNFICKTGAFRRSCPVTKEKAGGYNISFRKTHNSSVIPKSFLWKPQTRKRGCSGNNTRARRDAVVTDVPILPGYSGTQ